MVTRRACPPLLGGRAIVRAPLASGRGAHSFCRPDHTPALPPGRGRTASSAIDQYPADGRIKVEAKFVQGAPELVSARQRHDGAVQAPDAGPGFAEERAG